MDTLLSFFPCKWSSNGWHNSKCKHTHTKLDQAIDVALVREANSIGLEEILFVLRKNKIKLSRLYHHLHLKDTIEMVNRNMSGIVRSTLQLNPSTNYYSTNSNYVNEC